jgi:hypothetical protein
VASDDVRLYSGRCHGKIMREDVSEIHQGSSTLSIHWNYPIQPNKRKMLCMGIINA